MYIIKSTIAFVICKKYSAQKSVGTMIFGPNSLLLFFLFFIRNYSGTELSLNLLSLNLSYHSRTFVIIKFEDQCKF